MASKLLVIFGLLAVIHAGFAWHHQRPMHFFPGFMPFAPFPPFPPSMIRVPTPAEIAAMRPGPGQMVNAVSVQSTNQLSRDKDGNVISTGGSTIVTNQNGQVETVTVGNSPPPLNRVITVPPMHMDDFEFPEFPEMPEIHFPKMKKMEPFKFEPIIIEPPKMIDPDDLRHHLPKDNENFVGVHSSSFSHTSSVNGQQTSSGGSEVIVNNNGKVDEDSVRYQHGDKPTKGKKKKAFEDISSIKTHKFKPFKFEPIVITPPKNIDIKHHLPKKNEKFVAFSTSSFSSSSDFNGVKSSSGGSHTILNDNGKVDEEKVKYVAGDKKKVPADKSGEEITIENE